MPTSLRSSVRNCRRRRRRSPPRRSWPERSPRARPRPGLRHKGTQSMKLYYSPGACSLAVRISLHEIDAAADFERVDLKTKTTEHGVDFRTINAKGYVPMLVLDDGATITEIDAILDYIADRHPELAPGAPLGRTRL